MACLGILLQPFCHSGTPLRVIMRLSAQYVGPPPNRPTGLQDSPMRPPRRLQNGRKFPEDRAPSKPPRGSMTAQTRLEVARNLFNDETEKPKSSNLRPCRCDPKGFSGLRCTRIRPHMRGKEGRGGLRYTVVRPWWRLLRSQTRAPLFFVLLLLRSQGGSREAQDVLKNPPTIPHTPPRSPNGRRSDNQARRSSRNAPPQL